MRKRIYLEKSSGSTVVINEFTTRDILPILHFLNNTPKEVLALYKNPEHVGRKYKMVAEFVACHVFRHFMHILVNRLMESDRLVIDDQLSLFIGTVKKNPKKVAKARKKKQIYFATLGRRYGVVLHGMEHDFYFRMPYRRRKELYDRITEGQNFFNQIDTAYV